MGQIASDINPATILADAVKSTVHDCAVFVCNACRSECGCGGCLVFAVQTFETHEDDSSSSSNSDTHCCGE